MLVLILDRFGFKEPPGLRAPVLSDDRGLSEVKDAVDEEVVGLDGGWGNAAILMVFRTALSEVADGGLILDEADLRVGTAGDEFEEWGLGWVEVRGDGVGILSLIEP